MPAAQKGERREKSLASVGTCRMCAFLVPARTAPSPQKDLSAGFYRLRNSRMRRAAGRDGDIRGLGSGFSVVGFGGSFGGYIPFCCPRPLTCHCGV